MWGRTEAEARFLKYGYLSLSSKVESDILVLPSNPSTKGGIKMLITLLITFIVSVAANVASHYICKWLDRDRDGTA